MLQKQIPMKKIVSLTVILVSFFGYSQNFKGEISGVKQSGVNQITIAPEIRALAKNDLRYFRIIDRANNQVPYVIVDGHTSKESYQPFAIISKENLQDSITSIIIQNEEKKEIGQFSLQIVNSALTKSYSVSGSNDAKEWFGLVENETLTNLIAAKGTSVTQTISFPANTYSFLRIIFNDKKSLPLNIKSVGIAKIQLIPDNFLEVTNFNYKISEDKDRKVTIIHFLADNSFQIEALAFDIKTDYFNRSATIAVKRNQQIKKRSLVYKENVAQFMLSSKKDKTIYFDAIDEKEFTVEIENQDNQPLAISAIRVLQKPVVVVARLIQNEKYQVIVDTTLEKPNYDLGNSITEKRVNLPEVRIVNFKKLDTKKIIHVEMSFWQTNLFMWICIAFGGGVVAYFAFGLLKDMKE
jgi:hypothetical protein